MPFACHDPKADRAQRWARVRAWVVGPLLAVTAGGLGACASSARRAAVDPDRQSIAEMDLGADFLGRGELRQALERVQKAIDLNDENQEAQHLAALVYLGFCARSQLECRLPLAEKHARIALKLKPDFREATNTLGVVLIHEKRAAEAILVLEPLTRDILYVTPWTAWGNLGWAYLEVGKVDDAVEALRRSIAAQPAFCVGNFRLGLAYEKKGDLGAAREALTRALETEQAGCRTMQDALEARGRVLAKAKKCPEARDDWERCKQLGVETTAGESCAARLRASDC